MSNEIENQAEVQADGELNEDELMNVAGGATTLKAAVKTVINPVATAVNKVVAQTKQQGPSNVGH